MAKDKGLFKHILSEIKDTLFPENDNDSKSKKTKKKIGWIMFLILMGCGTLSMLIAVSFAH